MKNPSLIAILLAFLLGACDLRDSGTGTLSQQIFNKTTLQT